MDMGNMAARPLARSGRAAGRLGRMGRIMKVAPSTVLFVGGAVLLAGVYFTVFFYYPFVQNLYWMFTDFTLLSFLHPTHWVGLANFNTFFHDATAHQAFVSSFIYAVASVPLIVVVALALALALHHITVGKPLLRVLVFLTYLMPTIASGLVFRQLLGQYGLINSYVSDLGLPRLPWLTDALWGQAAIVLFFVWKNSAFFMIILLAGLSNMNAALTEAASIDGAGPIQRFLNVTIPQLRPALLYCVIVSTINALNIYPEVVAVTQGGPAGQTRSIMYYMLDEGFGMNSKVGYASVIAFFLFIVVLVITLVQMRVTRFYED